MFAVSAALIVGSAGKAWAIGDGIIPGALAVTPGTGGVENAFYNYNSTLGWSFSVSIPVDVTALGYFDATGGGLHDAHPVGIFDVAGNLLTSATVPMGTAGSLQGGFRFVPDSYVLQPGNYEIGAYANATSLDPFLLSEHGSQTSPGVTLGSALSDEENSLGFSSRAVEDSATKDTSAQTS